MGKCNYKKKNAAFLIIQNILSLDDELMITASARA
jgi:hypothetical protein